MGIIQRTATPCRKGHSMPQFAAPLIEYALAQNLCAPEDASYLENAVLALFRADSPDEITFPELPEYPRLSELLLIYTALAEQRGLLDNDTAAARDRFAARLMGIFTPLPSHICLEFAIRQMQSAKSATDWFYHLCLANGYIRSDRMAKNISWQTDTPYGMLDLTINLSKPEKEPTTIASEAAKPAAEYPKCLICRENEGYAGRNGHPARQNLRLVPIRLTGEQWFFQYSPYAYFNEHCIILDERHIPMKIDRLCFSQLLDFTEQFPHYFVGSNADLPVVGGSILSHAHFQGGADRFAMAEAGIDQIIVLAGYEDLECGIVKWPLSVLRIISANKERIADLADAVLRCWQNYTDAERQIYAHTGSTPHHTITPIARFRNGKFELDLVLRDNYATDEHPLGLFHPHAEMHHIKKENIGLIEVLGRAILPARLKTEFEAVSEWIRNGMPQTEDPAVLIHADWVRSWRGSYPDDADWDSVLKEETGRTFAQILAQCGVFADTPDGRTGFLQFLHSIPAPENGTDA